MYARPKRNETDEDLLRMQEEFLKNKERNQIKLAATVVTDKIDVNEEKQTETSESTVYNIEDQIANTFEAIPDCTNIGNIIEKNISSTNKNENETNFEFAKLSGFPKAKRRDIMRNSSLKCSIFAQQMKKMKTSNNSENEKMEIDTIDDETLKTDFQESFILTGSDKSEIHEENIKKLNCMSQDEIQEARENLLSTMDPALIAFLKAKRKKIYPESNRNVSIKNQNEAGSSLKIDEIDPTKTVLEQPNAENWLNFDSVEINKLAWMKNVDLPKIEKNKSFEARFDFEGWLLPYSETDISEKSRILYHHGEDPGRPGYTLQELFQLSRSEVMQQKIIALNSISNLLSLYSTGVYNKIIDLPIEQIFFVLRFCLDDNIPAVLNASIKAMRNLIFNQIDETCLDCVLNFGLMQIQPILAIDENEDDNTVNDQQLVETNLIKCLARTEILARIRYVISTVQPPVETIVYCLDILMRLARDSDFIVEHILKCDNLLRCIIKFFLPKSTESSYGVPLVQAVKFLRILSSRNINIATILIKKHLVMDSIVYYLSNENYSSNANGIKLQTECLKLWLVLIHFNLSLDYFEILTPVLVELLNYHLKNTNLNMETTYIKQAHASSLLNLIAKVAFKNKLLVVQFLQPIEQCFLKWTAQFRILDKFLCGKLQILAAIINCVDSLIRNQIILNISIIDESILMLLQSKGFYIVTETIENGSMFLNNYETRCSSANLITLECAAWDASEHVIPIIQTNSSLPFLSAMSNYLGTTTNKNIKLAFLNHENVKKYVDCLINSKQYYLSNNWFSKVESNLLINILISSITIREDLSETSNFYELAVKSLNIFTFEQKLDIEKLLVEIIFNAKFFPNETLLQYLNINEKNETLNNLTEICEIYSKILGLKNNYGNFSTKLCLGVNLGNIIPIDWIYTPILILYTNQQQNKNLAESEQISLIKNCLKWILIYETYFPTLAALINPTDRFCRVACVFLGSDTLFLDGEIHDLLELILKNVISKYQDDLNFDLEIQGLSNFQDFFVQLLEQYQGVSYGDILFGNYLLFPLMQKHDVKWRKTLWSEYMGVVEIFNVTPEQCVCSMEAFLVPAEEDLSLLKCYRRAVGGNLARKHSILYKIAKYHVEQFIYNKINN